ncbi:hypothetical protein [Bradyrhizobium sp. Gha]|uniref:hypothetical protein n=1 Tax=Bradyrhizobium sp. Gha TaxID=1855318 RepID=UPI0008EF2D5F|nr:hypothetical protein [Bradyrhizobium sp. Gha]SFI62630.1 hypothetical protein SAMN05216525_11193 [Bradyrhizobium sp. Gha]
MQTSSLFETRTDKTALKMKVLVADLQRRIELLETDIAHEEARTRVQDLAHPTYSILARNLRSRRDNLLATIAILKRQLD